MQVTRRLDADGQEWESWNWRTEGDLMINGAFFVPSGDGVNPQYTLASSMEPKSAAFIDQLTLNAGVLLPNPNGYVSLILIFLSVYVKSIAYM